MDEQTVQKSEVLVGCVVLFYFVKLAVYLILADYFDWRLDQIRCVVAKIFDFVDVFDEIAFQFYSVEPLLLVRKQVFSKYLKLKLKCLLLHFCHLSVLALIDVDRFEFKIVCWKYLLSYFLLNFFENLLFRFRLFSFDLDVNALYFTILIELTG